MSPVLPNERFITARPTTHIQMLPDTSMNPIATMCATNDLTMTGFRE
jgi:hypothetical protein